MQGLCRPTSILELIIAKLASSTTTHGFFHSAIHCQVLNRCFINVHCMNQTAEEMREEQSNDDLSYHHKTAKAAFRYLLHLFQQGAKPLKMWLTPGLLSASSYGTDVLSFLSFTFFPPVTGYSKI